MPDFKCPHNRTDILQEYHPANNGGPLRLAEFRGANQTFQAAHYFMTRVKTGGMNLHRFYGGNAGKYGQYWVPGQPSVTAGNLSVQLDYAVLPAWKNTMDDVSTLRVPEGTIIFEGFAAGQRDNHWKLLGGGWQVFVPQAFLGPLVRLNTAIASEKETLVQYHLEKLRIEQTALMTRYKTHLSREQKRLPTMNFLQTACASLLRNRNNEDKLAGRLRTIMEEALHYSADAVAQVNDTRSVSVKLSLQVGLCLESETTMTYMERNVRVTESVRRYSRTFQWVC